MLHHGVNKVLMARGRDTWTVKPSTERRPKSRNFPKMQQAGQWAA